MEMFLSLMFWGVFGPTTAGPGVWRGRGIRTECHKYRREVHVVWVCIYISYACPSDSHPAVGRNVLVYAKAGESQTLGCIRAIFAFLLCEA